MPDNEYTSMGENPGIALTTCTGCGTAGGFGEGGGYRCENCGKPWAEADAPTPADLQLAHMLATNGGGMEQPPRIAPDECVVKRADLRELLDACIFRDGETWQHDALYTCDSCQQSGAGSKDKVDHDKGCVVARLTAAVAAASGDDGGTA